MSYRLNLSGIRWGSQIYIAYGKPPRNNKHEGPLKTPSPLAIQKPTDEKISPTFLSGLFFEDSSQDRTDRIPIVIKRIGKNTQRSNLLQNCLVLFPVVAIFLRVTNFLLCLASDFVRDAFGLLFFTSHQFTGFRLNFTGGFLDSTFYLILVHRLSLDSEADPA